MAGDRLTEDECAVLADLLVAAFPRDRLESLVHHRLRRTLAPFESVDDAISDLVTTANADLWWRPLLVAVRAADPKDAGLQAFGARHNLGPEVIDRHGDRVRQLESHVRRIGSEHNIAHWRARLGELEGQICRIEFGRGDHRERGTGFLVGPDLVLTNHHVVRPVLEKKVPPSAVTLLFDHAYLEDGKKLTPGTPYRLASDWCVAFSPSSAADRQADPVRDPEAGELDFALLRVDGRPGEAPVGGPTGDRWVPRGWITMPDEDYDFDSSSALHIVQHPAGRPMVVVFDTDAVIGTNPNGTRVRYRTNTEPGSSGAPCFGRDLQWVAIHQTGDADESLRGFAEYNQGIPVAALRRELSGLLPDAAELAALVGRAQPTPTTDERSGHLQVALTHTPDSTWLAYELEKYLERSPLPVQPWRGQGPGGPSVLLCVTTGAADAVRPVEVEDAVAAGADVIAIVPDVRSARPRWMVGLDAVDGRDGWKELDRRLDEASKPVRRLRVLVARRDAVRRERRRAAPAEHDRLDAELRDLDELIALATVRLSEPLDDTDADFKCFGQPSEVTGDDIHDRKPYLDKLVRLLTDPRARHIFLQGSSGIGMTGVVAKLRTELEAGVAPEYRSFVYIPAFGLRPVDAERFVTAVAEMLRDGDEARVVRAAQRSGQPWRDVLNLVLDGLGDRCVCVVIDNADELLDREARFVDRELREVIDRLVGRRDHRVRLILVGEPGGSGRDRVPEFCDALSLAEGLTEPDDRRFLLELDATGEGRLTREPPTTVTELCRVVDGWPRALELLFALLSLAPALGVDDLIDELRRKTTRDAMDDVRRAVLEKIEPAEVKILQALAIYGRPVSPAAVDDLLRPHVPEPYSAGRMLRLHRLRLIRRNGGGFFLPPRDDQRAVMSTIAEGGRADLVAPTRRFTRVALSRLAADHFARHRTPRKRVATPKDLDNHLNEIDLRIQAGQYRWAMARIRAVNKRHLMRWGRASMIIRRLELLEDKLWWRGEYRRRCALAWAFSRQQRPDEVIDHATAALRRALPGGETARLLYTIGSAKLEQDRSEEAVGYYRRTLRTIPLRFIGKPATTRAAVHAELGAVRMRVGDFAGARALFGKAWRLLPLAFERNAGNASRVRIEILTYRALIHSCLDEPDAADGCVTRAKQIAKTAPFTVELGKVHLHEAEMFTMRERWADAAGAAEDAGRIAEELGHQGLRRSAHEALARIAMCRDELGPAGDAVRIAVRHDPTVDGLALQGAIALRTGDKPAALSAFEGALSLLPTSPGRDYHLLDLQGLILTGMALASPVDRPDLIEDAVIAFQAARAVTSAPGVVESVTLLVKQLGTPAAPVPDVVLAALSCTTPGTGRPPRGRVPR
ncbi:hypothetical protein GCM10009557_54310 [Virgisporangium ochraceum]|uniref:Serine protease n=1 Tax=Virgisporangium ochraceum TaxID=65505 RepID=A0A8J4A1Z4_9ACTN|nr:trypsin-like peptidase domain-containing protein [Virgisporangium ochraceum]GIJ72668.1 hypothetical protein Voc01_075850 [Virgisporangium ochraceum]